MYVPLLTVNPYFQKDYVYFLQPKMAANVQTQNQNQDSSPEAPQQKDGKQTWGEYGKQVYNEQYERWMPWIEDMYLRYFTRDNKASYATKGTSNVIHPFIILLYPIQPYAFPILSRPTKLTCGPTKTIDTLGKTKITGVKQIDNLQDGAHNLVAGQVGQDGLLKPVGDVFSKEGLNRAERGGKDEQGSYAPGPAGAVVNPVAQGGQKLGGAVLDGGKSVGGAVGGLFGGGKK